jgi:hypothetical protein
MPTRTPGMPCVDEDVLRSLPPVLRAVVRALGLARARAWLAIHGGLNIHLPKFRTAALGLEADELMRLRMTLAPHLNENGRVWLPKADRLLRQVRDANMRRERHMASITVLARRYGLSVRQVCNICREGDDAQLDLF